MITALIVGALLGLWFGLCFLFGWWIGGRR